MYQAFSEVKRDSTYEFKYQGLYESEEVKEEEEDDEEMGSHLSIFHETEKHLISLMETIHIRVGAFETIFEEHDEGEEESSVEQQIQMKQKYNNKKKPAIYKQAQNFAERLWSRLTGKSIEENEVPSSFFNIAVSDHPKIKENRQRVRNLDPRFRSFSELFSNKKKKRWMKSRHGLSQRRNFDTNNEPTRNHHHLFSSSAPLYTQEQIATMEKWLTTAQRMSKENPCMTFGRDESKLMTTFLTEAKARERLHRAGFLESNPIIM